jgi:hypothetical protein
MRQQVVAVAIVLTLVSNARANITYNIVDYPTYQTDTVGVGTDHISGTIITDGAFGDYAYCSTHLLGGTLQVTSPSGTYSYSLDVPGGNPNYSMFTATSSAILIYLNEIINLRAGGGLIDVTYARAYGADEYCGGITHNTCHDVAKFQNNTYHGGEILLGNLATSDPWIIATVTPEPSSLVLLTIGAISLFAYAWRWRRQAA